jgi:glyoxylase I family protein
MNLKLHHLNLTTTKVPEMDNFYRSILGLEREPSLGSDRMTQGYGAEVAFVTDGATQFHLATKDLGIVPARAPSWANVS